MLEKETEKRLNRNIALLGIYKVFTKRVFLPVTTIYATQQAGMTIQQIGLVASLSSIISFLCDTATGFWADKHGRKKSAMVGSALLMVSSLLYILSNNFVGILGASFVAAIGYSFVNGSVEALIHDTLVVLKRQDDYAKVASRAQSLALVGNAVLVALVPLLYPIDRRLPFVAALFAYMALFYIALLLLEPAIKHDVEAEERRFFRTVRLLVNRKTALFFLCLGLIYATNIATFDVFNLAPLQLGFEIKYMGLIFAGASLLGAALGLVVHNLRRLGFKGYAAFDVVINILPFVMYGIFKSLPLGLVFFMLSTALWRYETIMYQSFILKVYGTTRYKATIISITTNASSLNQIWMGVALTGAAQHLGLLNSFPYDAFGLVLFLPLFLFSISQFSANAKAEVPSTNQ